MMILHIELYPFTTLSVISTLLKGHSSVNQLQMKLLCSYLIKLKLVGLLITPSRSRIYHYVLLSQTFEGDS